MCFKHRRQLEWPKAHTLNGRRWLVTEHLLLRGSNIRTSWILPLSSFILPSLLSSYFLFIGLFFCLLFVLFGILPCSVLGPLLFSLPTLPKWHHQSCFPNALCRLVTPKLFFRKKSLFWALDFLSACLLNILTLLSQGQLKQYLKLTVDSHSSV